MNCVNDVRLCNSLRGCCLDYTWIMYELCMDHAQIKGGIFVDYVWIMYRLCTDYLWIMCGFGMDYVWIMY